MRPISMNCWRLGGKFEGLHGRGPTKRWPGAFFLEAPVGRARFNERRHLKSHRVPMERWDELLFEVPVRKSAAV